MHENFGYFFLVSLEIHFVFMHIIVLSYYDHIIYEEIIRCKFKDCKEFRNNFLQENKENTIEIISVK